MLTKTVLASLQALSEKDSPTLTIYLDIDQNQPANRKGAYVVRAESMLKELKSKASKDGAALDQAHKEAISMLKELEPSGRTALVVVNPQEGFRHLEQLKVTLPEGAFWQKGTYLRPLLEAMDEYERYAVVLTDKMKARIFTVYMGEITEHKDLWSPTPPKVAAVAKDEMWSQARIQRHHEAVAASHAKRVVEALQELSSRLRYDRLVVAGPTEAASMVAKLLPKRLRGKLVETISLPVTASQEEVLEKVAAVQERMERKHELELVQALMSELHEGGKAVAGLKDVCQAVAQARVWRLLYTRGYSAQGARCQQCGSLIAEKQDNCPVCGSTELEHLERFVDALSRAVVETGGQVEVVAGEAAERLESVGSIAAFLRF